MGGWTQEWLIWEFFLQPTCTYDPTLDQKWIYELQGLNLKETQLETHNQTNDNIILLNIKENGIKAIHGDGLEWPQQDIATLQKIV